MSKGRFGIHGGQYVPETLMNEIINLEKQYEHYKNDPDLFGNLTRFSVKIQTALLRFIIQKF